jgi:hypothetical protein
VEAILNQDRGKTPRADLDRSDRTFFLMATALESIPGISAGQALAPTHPRTRDY